MLYAAKGTDRQSTSNDGFGRQDKIAAEIYVNTELSLTTVSQTVAFTWFLPRDAMQAQRGLCRHALSVWWRKYSGLVLCKY